ncbi:MAG: UDP-phosphate glucose phosphotransferase [Candidatus Peregrinibacteria bacterium GW2011_GWC2_33_13]|nr:MAG: UDP-phosphate glucose phosphotransferase [Candidatus Peregrinibacteria bacterium GW2011_GWC2_33_13]
MKSLIKFIDQKLLLVGILLFSDIVWFLLAFLSAYNFRNKVSFSIQPIEVYLKVLPFVLMLLIIVFHFYGLYQKKNRISKISEIYLIIKAETVCLILIMAASFLQKYDYSRGLVMLFWMFGLIYLNFGRFLIRFFLRLIYKKGRLKTQVLIIGAGIYAKKVINSLENYKDFGYEIIGVLDDKINRAVGHYPNLGNVNKLTEIIKNKNISEIYFADPGMPHEEILKLMQNCENYPVKFKIVSNLFEIISGNIDISEIEGIPSLDFSTTPNKLFYNFFKRLLDFVIAIIGVIILIPFWFIIIFAIRLDSKGPALFIQNRVGKNSRVFKIYKFRTMFFNTPREYAAPKKNTDDRITKVGRFLRKTSLDETPQLINVIIGNMSIVGPRPEMPFIVEKYQSWQKKRLSVKPGITGLWQVLGRKELPLLNNLHYDFYYIKNQSFLLDLVIIYKTIIIILTGKGAY